MKLRCVAKAKHCFPGRLLLALNIAGRCWWVKRPAAQWNPSFNPLCQSYTNWCERTGGSLQPVRREPPATRSGLLEVGAHTARLGCSGGRVPGCPPLHAQCPVTRLDCTDRCPEQQQPVATSAQSPVIYIVTYWVPVGFRVKLKGQLRAIRKIHQTTKTK